MKTLQKIYEETLSQGYSESSSNNALAYYFALAASKEGYNEESILRFLQLQTKMEESELRKAIENAFKAKGRALVKDISKTSKAPNPEAVIEEAIKFLNEKIDIRFNVVHSRLEMKEKDEAEDKYRPVKEGDENSIWIRMRLAKINIAHKTFLTLLNSDVVEIFHPYTNYYNSIPTWDRETDFIESLARTIKTTNDPYFRKCLKKFLVNVVATSMDSQPNHQVLVLQGEQGVGKTTWLNKLLPKKLANYLYLGAIDPSSRESLVHLIERMFINLDELENLNKTELNALKSFITSAEVLLRKWYGRYYEKYERRASILASINSKSFLRDTTGDRRFLCFEVLEIDYKHNIEMDMVYSQALALYKDGFKFVFDTEDYEEISQNNEQFREQAPEEELIMMHYRKPLEGDVILYMDATQIIDDLNLKIHHSGRLRLDEGTKIRIGRIVAKHKFERVKIGGCNCYKIAYSASIPPKTVNLVPTNGISVPAASEGVSRTVLDEINSLKFEL